MRRIRAVRDMVIVADIEARTVTDSGLHLGRPIERPISVVVSVGPLVNLLPYDPRHPADSAALPELPADEQIRPGDTVLWVRSLGTGFDWHGTRLNILRAGEILGIVARGRYQIRVIEPADGADPGVKTAVSADQVV